MPKFTGSLATLVLNSRLLTATLDKKLTDILVEGTGEWVRTVANIIPSWSGQSLASIKPLADLVNVSIFNPVAAGAPDRRATGEAQGFGNLITEGGVYGFEYRSDVFYLIYNEFNNANLVGFHLRNPGPYESQKQAEKAFNETVNRRLRSLDFGVQANITVVRRPIR